MDADPGEPAPAEGGRWFGLARGWQHRPAIAAILTVYTVAAISIEMARQLSFTAWHVVLAATVLALWFVPLPRIVWDAACFLFVGMAFLDLAPAKPEFAQAHPLVPIGWEQAIFAGTVLPVWLQQHVRPLLLGGPTALLCFIYLLHFVSPPVAGLWLWWRRPHAFEPFLMAYLLSMLVGFVIYLFYAEAPPWIAAQHGLLPPVHRDIYDFMEAVGLGNGYNGADPEPYGAIPALHATVPLMVAVGLIAAMRSRWRWLWLGYPLVVCFAALELGEHYAPDLAAGWALGLSCWAVTWVGYRWARRGAAGQAATAAAQLAA